MENKPEDKIGEEFENTVTGKTSLIIHGQEGEYQNTEEYLLLNNGKHEKIIISRQPNMRGSAQVPGTQQETARRSRVDEYS